jgi:hypothetical protein
LPHFPDPNGLYLFGTPDSNDHAKSLTIYSRPTGILTRLANLDLRVRAILSGIQNQTQMTHILLPRNSLPPTGLAYILTGSSHRPWSKCFLMNSFPRSNESYTAPKMQPPPRGIASILGVCLQRPLYSLLFTKCNTMMIIRILPGRQPSPQSSTAS